MLSLVSNPGQLLNPAHTDTIPCEYLSLERMECWIVFGFAVCHSALGQVSDIVWPSPGPTLFSANIQRILSIFSQGKIAVIATFMH